MYQAHCDRFKCQVDPQIQAPTTYDNKSCWEIRDGGERKILLVFHSVESLKNHQWVSSTFFTKIIGQEPRSHYVQIQPPIYTIPTKVNKLGTSLIKSMFLWNTGKAPSYHWSMLESSLASSTLSFRVNSCRILTHRLTEVIVTCLTLHYDFSC